MEKHIEELKRHIPFKETTVAGDVVLMLREVEDGEIAAAYAMVTGFDPDVSKRDEWWHVHFLFFELPPTARTIILQTLHFTGQEIFTMGGRKVFMKALDTSAFKVDAPEDAFNDEETASKTRVPGDDSKERKVKPTFTLVK